MHPAPIRRPTLAALLAALLVLAAPRPAAAAAPETGGVLLIGDSNIYGQLGRALERDLLARGYRVHRRGKPTSGLARPDFFDWFAEARRLLDLTVPRTVVILFGGNDGQNLLPADSAERRVPWEDEARWTPAYEARVRRLMELLSADGRSVVLLSPTNRAPAISRARMVRIRAAMKRAVAGLPRVTYLDMFPFTSDPHGRWLQSGLDAFGRRVPFRRGDGIHLTPEGGAEVSRRLLPTLTHLL